MAAVLRFQELAPALTPPPSDRGDCEDVDITMLNPESYLPEGFYPSPAPSFSCQQQTMTPYSPDIGCCDSTYDTEEESHQTLFFNSTEGHMLPQTTSFAVNALYATTIPYQTYEQQPWLPYNGYASNIPLFPYADDGNSTNPYATYVPQIPSSMIPPMPQGVAGASFNFNEPVTTAQSSTSYLRSLANSSARQQSPLTHSAASVCELSSRCSSPDSSSLAPLEALDNRRESSVLTHRSSSSSLHAFGILIRSHDSTTVQAWRCAFPHCTSRAVFTRGCDLRKHYNRHSKHLFCRVNGCPQSESACIAVARQQAIQSGEEHLEASQLAISGGFSSKKDRARHEAKHNPGIKCEWKGMNGEECGRVFSRMDNMKDHVRRIHNKGEQIKKR